jgi:uncharacterized membrane protein YbaN (DUF454 family)
MMARRIYMFAGLLCVGLGMLGAFLPLLPTTPFLLLALWLFDRSSPRLREWLLGNRLFGRYLRDYRAGRGIPLAGKAGTLVLLWAAIGFSVLRMAESVWLKAGLLAVAVGVTIHVMAIGTSRHSDKK